MQQISATHQASVQAAWERMDENKDGKIDREEVRTKLIIYMLMLVWSFSF